MTTLASPASFMDASRGAAWRGALRGRRITVVGLARSGVAACRLLLDLGAVVTGTDHREASALGETARALGEAGVRLYLGAHPVAAFAEAELVVVSPGVASDLPVLSGCRARGVPVLGELELAFRTTGADFVAITGTNGKTTTTALTGALVAESGRPVLVGGNIGRPLAAEVLDLPAHGIVVAEVSSFQLETTVTFRPRVAALLNVTPDHLDRHRTLAEYAAAKARVFRCQTPDDFAVVNADDALAAALGGQGQGRCLWFSRMRSVERGTHVRDGWVTLRLDGVDHPVCPLGEIFLRGAHNLENVLAATAAAGVLGVAPERLRRAIAAFRGVPHRLEWVRTRNGVAYYNDSKGTNEDATLKALAAFTEPVVLIAGGRDKGQRFERLASAVRGRVRAAILIGEARASLRAVLHPVTRVLEAESLPGAVAESAALAVPGDVVLLSPACASFDMFRDYEHRGQVFVQAVRGLSGAEGPSGPGGPRVESR